MAYCTMWLKVLCKVCDIVSNVTELNNALFQVGVSFHFVPLNAFAVVSPDHAQYTYFYCMERRISLVGGAAKAIKLQRL